jgi:hypothetical protein
MLESMELQGQHANRGIDVTGLPEEAIQAVQSLIAVLGGQRGTGHPGFVSREKWAEATKEWADSHPEIDNPADDSRESSYAG